MSKILHLKNYVTYVISDPPMTIFLAFRSGEQKYRSLDAVKLPLWTRVSGFSVSEEFISFRVQKRIPNLIKRLIGVLKSRVVILRKYEYSKNKKYTFLQILANISLFDEYPNCTSINMWCSGRRKLVISRP